MTVQDPVRLTTTGLDVGTGGHHGVGPARRTGAQERRSPWPRTPVGLLVVAAIPILVFGGFAASGHVLMEADNLIQNFPLRALVGVDLRHGQLPLWDPYLASGTSLLGGFNAGAAYPGTWLFALLPAQGAWAVNVIVVYEVALFGMFVFLRRQTLSRSASTLGAAVFTLGGFMSAQFTHIDLIEGAAWLPWVLVALDGIFTCSAEPGEPGRGDVLTTGDRTPMGEGARRRLIRFAVLLASVYGLSILAGAPEAFIDGGVLAALYGLWLLRRLPKGHRVRYLVGAGAGVVGALLLSTAQWLPGWAFSHISQRAASNYAFFTSGSWPIRLTTLLFSPFLMGTNLDHPSYWFGPYNFPEVTGYVGVTAVIAAFALMGRRWWRHPTAWRWRVWYLALVLGLLLAWGGYTPFGRLEYLVPFLNQQRLLNRNLLIVDFALVVLLAWWAELALFRRGTPVADRPDQREGRGTSARPGLPRPGGRRWSGRLPVAVSVALVVVLAAAEWLSTTTWWATGLPRLIGEHFAVSRQDLVAPAVLATVAAVLAVGVAVLAGAGYRLRRRRVVQLTALVVVVDLLAFNLFVLRPPEPQAVVTQHGRLADQLAAATGTGSRFAVYDPDRIDYSQLLALGQDDLNVLRGLPTIEDYTALVGNDYFEATGAHGQDELGPGVFSTPVVNQLNLGVLLSVPSYFMTPVDPARSRLRLAPATAAQPRAPSGDQDVELGAGGSHTWYTGGTAAVRTIHLTLSGAAGGAPALEGLELGVVGLDGTVRWLTSRSGAVTSTVGDGTRSVVLSSTTDIAGLVVRNSGSTAVNLTPPGLDTANFGAVHLQGVLQNQVQAPRWHYRSMIGPFAVFKNTAADGWAWLTHPMAERPSTPAAGTPAPDAGVAGTVRRVSTTPWGTDRYLVAARGTAELVRSESYLHGWTATVTPVDAGGKATGPATAVSVGRSGIIQTATVPPGRSIVTFVYRPELAMVGLGVSALAAIGAGLVLLGTWRRPRHLLRVRHRPSSSDR